MLTKPKILNEEIPLDSKKYIISETDAEGKITYCNDYFIEISGYSKEELIGSPHNIVRHPDMPRIVFKLLWDTIQNGHNINAIVKNLAKDGKFYWIFTEFEIKKDLKTDEIIGYQASRKTISKHVKEVISDLYSKLLEIEKKESVEASEKYLLKFLKEKGEDVEFSNIMENIYLFY